MNTLLTAITTTEQVAALDVRLSAHATRVNANARDMDRRFAADRNAIHNLAERQSAVDANLRHSLAQWEERFKSLEAHTASVTATLGATTLICIELQQAALQNEQRLAASHAEMHRLLQRVSALVKDQVHHEEELLAAAAGGGSRY